MAAQAGGILMESVPEQLPAIHYQLLIAGLKILLGMMLWVVSLPIKAFIFSCLGELLLHFTSRLQLPSLLASRSYTLEPVLSLSWKLELSRIRC